MPGASIIKAAVLCLLLSTVLAVPTKHHPASKHATAPPSSVHLAISEDFPDPGLYHEGQTWYTFATNAHNLNVQVASSQDFTKWDIMKNHDALPTPGKWVNHKNPAVWAPSVIRNDAGKYVLYYSADVGGKGRHCVGAATADNPEGPYDALDTPMFCDVAKGGAIDASAFQDHDGKRYVVYKVDGNSVGHGGSCGNGVKPFASTPLMLQPVAKDGIAFAGASKQILDRDWFDGPLVEAPSLVRTSDGKYVLFFSSNCYNTKLYDIGYAIADKIEGPYIKAGPLAVTGTQGLESPGGATIAADGRHMVFHANTKQGRSMYTALVSIDTGRHTITW